MSSNGKHAWVRNEGGTLSYLAAEGQITSKTPYDIIISNLKNNYKLCEVLPLICALTVDPKKGIYVALEPGGRFAILHFLSDPLDDKIAATESLSGFLKALDVDYSSILNAIKGTAPDVSVKMIGLKVEHSSRTGG